MFNTSVQLPSDLLNLATRYTHLSKKVIVELSQALLRKRKENNSHEICKIKGEINRVYFRRRRILREITRRLPHFLAAVLIKKQCKLLRIERLSIDPTGTKGALAKAIYNMPDNLLIYKKAVWLASKATDVKTGLVVSVFNRRLMVLGLLRDVLDRILRHDMEQIEIEINTVEPENEL